MDSFSISEQIFRAGVDSVLPDKMIRSIFKLESDTLYISKHIFQLSEINHIYVIGAGKASALMAKEVENILGNRISEGHIVVKHGHAIDLEYIRVTEAGHPTPDSHGLQATSSIIDMIFKAEKQDLVICLISGGGSSLLADLPIDIALIDLIEMNQFLINSGATIHEINAVRKHVSQVKGGQLAKTIFPATLVTLILSDVIGDSLDVIASGPTSPDPMTFFDAINVLEKYCVLNQMPSSIIKHLYKGLHGVIPETPKPGDSVFDNTHNLIIGSNRIALEAAQKKAFEMALQTTIVTSELNGDSVQAAEYIVQYAIDVQRDDNQQKPVCLLFGGETTIQVLGKGLGGRNQHLALCSSRLLENRRGITILAAGTDGNDGPTNAAGAVVDGETYGKAMSLKIDPNKFINEFDSYHFFKQVGGHIITGSTLTNVMDLVVVLVE
jgi:hydroxypyruvate reductase/glycerate 2-kinase